MTKTVRVYYDIIVNTIHRTSSIKKLFGQYENICDDDGEQQTDKVATSLTLKVCCRRKGGEEGVGCGEERV